MRQELRYEGTDCLNLDIFVDGKRSIPSAVSVKIYEEALLLEEIAAEAVTIPETDDPVYCQPGSDVVESLREYCRALWTVTLASGTRTISQIFDVVRVPLIPTLTDGDLIVECPDLRGNEIVVYGTAQDGSSDTIVDTDLAAPTDYWIGSRCEILDGDNAGEVGLVASFNSLTNTLTLGSSFSGEIIAGVGYKLKKSWVSEINQAWSDLITFIRQKGFRPALIIDPEALEIPHRYLALEKVCRSIADNPQSIWWEKAELYQEKYEKSLRSLQFKYDSDEDLGEDTVKTVITRFRR